LKVSSSPHPPNFLAAKGTPVFSVPAAAATRRAPKGGLYFRQSAHALSLPPNAQLIGAPLVAAGRADSRRDPMLKPRLEAFQWD
jgi:hypothetical protein